MAQPAITEDSIRAALIERLKATHVEIQDMSGMIPTLTLSLPDVIPIPNSLAITIQSLPSMPYTSFPCLFLHTPDFTTPNHHQQQPPPITN
jgi:hypothetical protein